MGAGRGASKATGLVGEGAQPHAILRNELDAGGFERAASREGTLEALRKARDLRRADIIYAHSASIWIISPGRP